MQTPLVSAAMAARELPTRVAAWLGQDRPAPEPPPELTLGGDGPGLDGWLSLGQVTGREIAAIEG